jgi:DNA-directed RNA polymerase subunit RPC12/RpoP
MKPFEVIEGSKDKATFVCTYCSSRFVTRVGLNEHWQTDPRCRTNRTVSNPLQSKYGEAGLAHTVPGEHTLHLVRAKDCPHDTPRDPLTDVSGTVIGYQCNYCFSVFPEQVQ